MGKMERMEEKKYSLILLLFVQNLFIKLSVCKGCYVLSSNMKFSIHLYHSNVIGT